MMGKRPPRYLNSAITVSAATSKTKPNAINPAAALNPESSNELTEYL